jgi:hypothetical protein
MTDVFCFCSKDISERIVDFFSFWHLVSRHIKFGWSRLSHSYFVLSHLKYSSTHIDSNSRILKVYRCCLDNSVFCDLYLPKANLNGSSGSISDLKPKGPGFESQIRQGYICWWRGSKRSGCVMNVSPCGFQVKGFALMFPKNLITN